MTSFSLLPLTAVDCFFAHFGLDFALVLHPPTRICIPRAVSFVLALLIFIGIYIRNTVDAVHDLDRAKLDPALQLLDCIKFSPKGQFLTCFSTPSKNDS